jgi:hypothetical protein
MSTEIKCLCLEILSDRFGEEVEGDCLGLTCARYRIAWRELKGQERKKENGDEIIGTEEL